MGRTGSMYSIFHHLDPKDRCQSMQRFKSADWDVINALDVAYFKEQYPQDAVYINPTGTVTVIGPVHRNFFEKVTVPKFSDYATELVVWDDPT